MLFNPDPSKAAKKVIFTSKKKVQIYPPISPNNIQVKRAFYQKQLGILLDGWLSFKQHIDSAALTINSGIFVIKNSDTVSKGNT